MRGAVPALWCGLLAALCASGGCKQATTPTEVIVYVDAETPVRMATAELHVLVEQSTTARAPAGTGTDAGSTGTPTPTPAAFEQTLRPAWPLKLALVPRGGDAARTYTVTAEARDGHGAVIAVGKLSSGFVRGQKRFARILLEAACLHHLECTQPGVTCHAGACVSARLDPNALGSSRDMPASIGAPPRDAGTAGHDAGEGGQHAGMDAALDAGVADGGTVTQPSDHDGGADAGTRDSGPHGGGGSGGHAGGSDAGSGGGDAGSDAGAPKEDGVKCAHDDECMSTRCIDGFCCKTACADACSACNVAGSEGKCSAVPNGQMPASGHPDCGPDSKASCLRDGTCDGNQQCRRWDSNTVCQPSSCAAASNSVTAEGKCDGAGNCDAPTSITCAPFTCNAAGDACYGTCSVGGSECSSGNVCNNMSCGLKIDGSACNGDGECQNNHCVDHVCCNNACGGQCQACDVTTSRGMCTTLTSGQPHGSRSGCTGTGAVCGGACGGDPNQCTYPDGSTPCRAQSCTSATLSLAANCNGAGVCPASGTQACTAPAAHGTASCSNNDCAISCDKYYALSGNSCVAAWTQETSGTSDALLGIWGSSASDVYVVGTTGVLHSIGNGTWTQVFTRPNQEINLNSIWGDRANPQYVYVIGDTGGLFYTSDSGAHWTQQTSPTGLADFYAVAGYNYQTVFALGTHVITGSTAGWSEITQSTVHRYTSAANIFAAYMVAGTIDGGIYESDNNGVFNLFYSPGWSAVNGVWYDGDVFAVGPAGGLLHQKTDTGGNTIWPAQTSNTTQDLYGVAGGADTNNNYVVFYAVGNGGTILKSTGDTTWTPQTSNTTAGLRAVWASSQNDIYAVGFGGTIMHFKGP